MILHSYLFRRSRSVLPCRPSAFAPFFPGPPCEIRNVTLLGPLFSRQPNRFSLCARVLFSFVPVIPSHFFLRAPPLVYVPPNHRVTKNSSVFPFHCGTVLLWLSLSHAPPVFCLTELRNWPFSVQARTFCLYEFFRVSVSQPSAFFRFSPGSSSL